MLKIWGRTSSLNVQKVLWCCVELGVPFERVDWGGSFGGNDDPSYRAMNPHGRVPTIKDGERIVWESNTVIRYLCATRGSGGLYPSDAAGRSEIERWMDWQLAALNPAMTTLLIGYYRTPPKERNLVSLENARKQAIENWTLIDRWLEGRDYLTGSAFTLADVGNGILVHRWHSYPIERPTLPRLKAWYDRLAERDGFKQHVAGPLS
jgi:glutathione S-transferase